MKQKNISKEDFDALSKVERLNLINSVSGYKSAHLLGTKSSSGQTNLAVFNSVVHLGSDPAMITFTLRPLTVERHSFENLKTMEYFTLNAISENITAKAHLTSGNFPKEISEFEHSGLTPEYLKGFYAPYVQESPIKIGCKFLNSYLIKENGCLVVVAAIEEIHIDENMLLDDYWVRLDKGKVVAINGIDGYALPQLLDRYYYVRSTATEVESKL